MERPTIAASIDHTLLKPEATPEQAAAILREAAACGFASACVSPNLLAEARRLVGTDVPRCCVVIGFPSGAHASTVKAIEATVAIKQGADEIDVVAALPNLMRHDVDAAKAELTEIVRAARATRADVTIKIIVESAAITAGKSADEADAILANACRAVRESGADYIKTSTGFHPTGGATPAAVASLVRHAGGLKVKASGGIRTLADARTYLELGADRLGCSGGKAMLDELDGDATNHHRSGGAVGTY